MEYKDIKPLNTEMMEKARAREDSLVKPLGSLGRLEEYAVRLAGIRGRMGGTLDKRAVLVFAADNGIHAQGITPVPKEVTYIQTLNIAGGIAGVSVLAKYAGADVVVHNVGVEPPIEQGNVVDILVMNGTNDITQGPAMTRQQCEQAVEAGFRAAEKFKDCDVAGIGEMGICNTSTTAAVGAVLLDKTPEQMAGRGAGITDGQYAKKIGAIARAIEVNKPDKDDVIDVISKVGGLDIAAMTGAYLGCAHYGVPAVIDGFISICAALCAARIAPTAKDYMFASHKSYEQGYNHIMDGLLMRPAFDLEMRLGEGSGCPLMFEVLEMSLRVIDEMGTFEQGNIDAEEYVDIREKGETKA